MKTTILILILTFVVRNNQNYQNDVHHEQLKRSNWEGVLVQVHKLFNITDVGCFAATFPPFLQSNKMRNNNENSTASGNNSTDAVEASSLNELQQHHLKQMAALKAEVAKARTGIDLGHLLINYISHPDCQHSQAHVAAVAAAGIALRDAILTPQVIG